MRTSESELQIELETGFLETEKPQFKRDSHKSFKINSTWIKMAHAEKKRYNKANIKYMKIAQKLVYFAVLFVLIFILVIKVAECVETYFRHPTYIETKIVAQPKAIFPAMTVCPVKDGYKEDVLEVTNIYTHTHIYIYI